MRRGAFLVLLLLAVAVLGILLGGEDDSSESRATTARDAAASNRGALLEGTDGPSTSASLPPPPTSDLVPDGDPLEGPPPGALRGSVVGPDGACVAGVRLAVSLQRGGDLRPTVRTASDDEGRFAAGVRDVRGCIAYIQVEGVPGGFAPPDPIRVPWTGEDVAIRLERSVSISGVVLADPERGSPGFVALNAYWFRGGGTSRYQVTPSVKADGSFEVGGLPARTEVDLVATPAYERVPMEIRIGTRNPVPMKETTWKHLPAEAAIAYGVRAPARGVELRLGAPAALDLTVLDEGRPMAARSFRITPLTRTPSGDRLVTSDEEGRIVARGLRPGRYRIQPTKARNHRSHVIRVPSSTPRLDFSLATTHTLHGRVVGSDVSGFRVHVSRPGEPAHTVAMTDADGRFKCRFVEGRVDLRAGRFGDDRWGRVREVDPEAGEVEIQLESGASIAGGVFDVDGRPFAAEGWVVAFNEQVRARVALPPGGHFALHGLPPGRYTLHAGGHGIPRPAEVRDVAAGTRNVRIDIPTGR